MTNSIDPRSIDLLWGFDCQMEKNEVGRVAIDTFDGFDFAFNIQTFVKVSSKKIELCRPYWGTHVVTWKMRGLGCLTVTSIRLCAVSTRIDRAIDHPYCGCRSPVDRLPFFH